MKHLIVSVILIVIHTFSPSDSANILGVFHYPSYSHHIVFQKIVQDLSSCGHHLTILTVYPINKNFPNVTEICMGGSENESLNFIESKEKKFGILKMLYIIASSLRKRIENQLSHPEVKKLIAEAKNLNFDLLILEFLFQTPLIYFSELFNCPVIAIGTMDVTSSVHELIGNPANPNIHSDIFTPYEDGKMTMIERIKSTTFYLTTSLIVKIGQFLTKSIVKHHFPNSKLSLNELENRIEFLLVNSSPVFGCNRPITSNTILLGNMHIEPPNQLTGDLKNFLDSSINGIIYVSFGSNIKTEELSENTLNIFFKVFSKLKYDVLWKFENREIVNKSTNIYTSKWLPQADLLAHRNIKLFITHCGQHSVEEAIDREVPIVGIPFAVDQFKNALKVKNEQIGVILDFHSLSEENLNFAIRKAMQRKYKNKIKNLRKLINDVPMKSREKAIWWIEYAIRNKGMNRLKYSCAKIPFNKRYMLDIISIFILTFIFLLKIKNLFKDLTMNKKIKNQ
ncbi:hypothetical protein PVAND_008924 [Polypedilum vanderplanki]|uniref:UDP-glucuronosyltransferase n=1 Tax=Polypedilum vanderplanki TaxID=319348 RepID=A0A9J6CB35_POLVA|nr:hypothetical protein PVAND_008924 [Polypedilum vanderplanki]